MELKDLLREGLNNVGEASHIDKTVRNFAETNPLDYGAYILLIELSSRSDRIQSLIHWLECMIDNGINVNCTTAATIITTLCRNKRTDMAIYWFWKFIMMNIRIDAPAFDMLWEVIDDLHHHLLFYNIMMSNHLPVLSKHYHRSISLSIKGNQMLMVHMWLTQMDWNQTRCTGDILTLLDAAKSKLYSEDRIFFERLMRNADATTHREALSHLMNHKDIPRAIRWIADLPPQYQEEMQIFITNNLSSRETESLIAQFGDRVNVYPSLSTVVLEKLFVEGQIERVKTMYEDIKLAGTQNINTMRVMMKVADQEKNVKSMRQLFKSAGNKTKLKSDEVIGSILRKWKVTHE
ncbi:hypothetical protein PROFUN_06440 [Planoprotostelium fungivorum]|uniref:Pentatricopeptide repeat-containing protein n=1 Tax=Planoprotostelium fungivorum TaxID=1890364 RepID=A0A2P6MQY6_9EUKA|nr:hypothetical protein PROFUN_06440 [Planoprotostelium fungivorum]